MQDIEFTVENGRLYMLQCRNGKRTAKASVKIAVDMVSGVAITFPIVNQDPWALCPRVCMCGYYRPSSLRSLIPQLRYCVVSCFL